MKRSLIWFVVFFCVVTLIIALSSLRNARLDGKEDPQWEVRFQISKNGYLRGLTTSSHSSLPLVLGERKTSKSTGSVTTMYGDGDFANTPIGYVFEAQNDGDAKVWLSSENDGNEWALNAESRCTKDIKIFLDVQENDATTKHSDWIIRVGTSRRVLATGKREKNEATKADGMP